MAKKIARTGIKRDGDHMLYVKDGAVWSVPRKKAGKPKGAKKRLVQFASPASMDYTKNIYFIDKDGDVAAAARKKKKK